MSDKHFDELVRGIKLGTKILDNIGIHINVSTLQAQSFIGWLEENGLGIGSWAGFMRVIFG